MNRKKGLAFLLAGSLAVSWTFPVSGAAKSQATQKKQEIQSQIDSKESQVASLKKQRSEVMSAIKELDAKNAKAQEKLTDLEEQISQKQEDIEKNTEDLKEAQEIAKKQYQDMKKRIQYMYENGDGSILAMLLESENFAELLNKTEAFSQMTSYDREKLEEYQATCQQIQELEKKLESEKQELEDYKASAEEEKKSIEAAIGKKQQEISSFESSISAAEAEQADLEGELAIQEQILSQIKSEEEKAAKAAQEAKKKAEEKKEQSSAGTSQGASSGGSQSSEQSSSSGGSDSSETSSSGSSGSFVWPCPSYYGITSGYGPRTSPTAGASSNHKGVDMGASTGSPILAAASGTVTVASYSESSGNYVIIDHGGGLSTVYMHASALYVSAGQQVGAGETIAAVGSTGYSTGPHLHFGVMVNGSYVNPMNYL